MNVTHINYVVCIHGWEIICGLLATVFRKYCSRSGAPQAVTYIVKTVVSRKSCKIDTLLLYATNRNYCMPYQFVLFPMTLDDLGGHSRNAGLIKCNSTNICATFSTVLTDTARRAVPRR